MPTRLSLRITILLLARFRCRAFYQQIEYEAEIIEIETDTEGNKYATVRFAGYGNEETVWLTDIVASHGDEAWKKQVKEGTQVKRKGVTKVNRFCPWCARFLVC